MTGDIDKKIVKLKDLAIDRCRERIEQAKLKAKEVMNTPKPEGNDDSNKYSDRSSGITSSLKKRYGLLIALKISEVILAIIILETYAAELTFFSAPAL
jgi:hypothetical protein